MPNAFSTFEYETPAQVQERMRQQRVNESNAYNAQPRQKLGYLLGSLLASKIVKDPTLTRAQDTEKAVTQADEAFKMSVEDDPPANDLEKEIRRTQFLRDKVADVNPAAAAQLNTQLLTLGEAKFNRDRLTAADNREQTAFDLSTADAQDKAKIRYFTGGLTYVLDQKTNKAKSYDMLDPTSAVEFSAAAKQPGTIVMTPGDVADLYKTQTKDAVELRTALARSRGNVPSNYITGALKATDGLLSLYSTSNRLFDILSQNPDALTSTSKGGTALDKWITELGAGARAANGTKTLEGTEINGWLKQNGITNVRAQGLVVGLAYAIARAHDPSGRVSDKDLDAANLRIGGDNPNPQAILSNLNDILTSKTEELKDSLDSVPEDWSSALAPRRKKLDERSAEFSAKFEPWARGTARGATGIDVGTGPMGPGPAGAPPADKDGWSIVNGIKIRRQGGGKLVP